MSPEPATCAALITRAPVRRATSAQNDGPSSPCSWTMLSSSASQSLDDLLERRVDEHAAQLDAATQRRRDQLRLRARAAPWRVLVEDHPERPRSQLGRELRVGERRDAADLHTRGVLVHPSTVATWRRGELRVGRRSAFGRVRVFDRVRSFAELGADGQVGVFGATLRAPQADADRVTRLERLDVFGEFL